MQTLGLMKFQASSFDWCKDNICLTWWKILFDIVEWGRSHKNFCHATNTTELRDRRGSM